MTYLEKLSSSPKEEEEMAGLAELYKNPFAAAAIDWRTGRPAAVQKEIDDYIRMIRLDPRAMTPGTGKRCHYEATRILPRRGRRQDTGHFSETAQKSLPERWRGDVARTVRDQLKDRRAVSRQRSRTKSRSRKREVAVGPTCDSLDYEKVLALKEVADAKRSVGQQLRESRVAEIEVRDLDETLREPEGELESMVRDEYLAQQIKRIKKNQKEEPRHHQKRRRDTREERRYSQGKEEKVQHAFEAQQQERLRAMEATARDQALQELEKIQVLQESSKEVRCLAAECRRARGPAAEVGRARPRGRCLGGMPAASKASPVGARLVPEFSADDHQRSPQGYRRPRPRQSSSRLDPRPHQPTRQSGRAPRRHGRQALARREETKEALRSRGGGLPEAEKHQY